MTSTEPEEAPQDPTDYSAGGDRSDDAALPLSGYVRGTLRVYFQGGAVVERPAAQADARAFLAMQKDERGTDHVDWMSRQWFTWDPAKVVFSSFDAYKDQNWPISPEDRRKLEAAGHPKGIVTSLVDYWTARNRRTEPTYSVQAIAALHSLALETPDRKIWEAAAKAFEGQGSTFLARARQAAETGSHPRRDVPSGRPGTADVPLADDLDVDGPAANDEATQDLRAGDGDGSGSAGTQDSNAVKDQAED